MSVAKRVCVSISMGKDSLCLLHMLIEKGYPVDEAVFFNTGMEFEALYRTRDKLLPFLNTHGIKFTELHPNKPFIWMMLDKPVRKRGTDIIHKYGYSWCGGPCRWGTSEKMNVLKKYIGNNWDLVGIAADEPHRFEREKRSNRLLPLVDWGVTEADALQYCYDRGYTWEENGIPLYEILDRVSCWNCGNKNLKELYNIYLYLPDYWGKLKELQARTERPFRRNSGKTIFDLEKDFYEKTQKEDEVREKSCIFV
ncbi:3'-phosphoadenosine 5'-phosphosulfate sulfotransferase (PAPS reductase)/FAD synthetase [Dysgonomonas sp. PFB1-18]|uniref:phosphoadenosine phosphosulfate reductase domain-containing protein n=1 Tax=unclassified Dysgonomonas TaxID=2630389 RepID=UPI0024738A5B|nr:MULTISPECIES: phosphoadenosine phosphosulfate reductase family protein [unclassified Dysgonomonas]MDH6310907.1 3'-phosphoadenosine 5'-phosphosulfate sulfotransferase (PAPS reductase)/FAD synthetase [Dysgonomonas sp. PF1-14]MDH6341024.1 3'-phosphoadenosine 5'-phosphosulfate sulfotransferase (PAPS reductase)/FAD synthetase [Dysgonomonas sp. PF1-16]MDH6382707.1 3'-phosphoadenosine 5'-phosphosulfate sulfotransferase (PAPS reductase)/FAD synthetase [Dysgonomonas sp. PFB1-18]MDH6400030.1 3'-phosph